MKERKRAQRRKHKFRMRRRARRIFPHWDNIDKVADHLHYCHCPYCRNPRRLKGHPRTLQERRWEVPKKDKQ